MVLLAHIRDQRRVGRLMRQNGIQVMRSRKFKRTTDSDHAFNIAPNLLQQDSTASGPNQKWAGDITVAIVARTDGATMATLHAGGMGLSGRHH